MTIYQNCDLTGASLSDVECVSFLSIDPIHANEMGFEKATIIGFPMSLTYSEISSKFHSNMNYIDPILSVFRLFLKIDDTYSDEHIKNKIENALFYGQTIVLSNYKISLFNILKDVYDEVLNSARSKRTIYNSIKEDIVDSAASSLSFICSEFSLARCGQEILEKIGKPIEDNDILNNSYNNLFDKYNKKIIDYFFDKPLTFSIDMDSFDIDFYEDILNNLMSNHNFYGSIKPIHGITTLPFSILVKSMQELTFKEALNYYVDSFEIRSYLLSVGVNFSKTQHKDQSRCNSFLSEYYESLAKGLNVSAED